MMSCVTFARYVDYHTFCHTSRDVDFHNLLAFGDASAATFVTFVLDNLTFAMTGGTYALRLHHAEDALCGVGDNTRAVTRRTTLATATILGTCAVTMAAGNILAHLELLGDTRVNLLQGEAHLQSQVTASVLLWT